MLDQGIIQRSNSPWASPLQLVIKKSGKVRPCVDYRRVNALTIPNAYPLARIQNCLDAVSGATLFSTFDLTSPKHSNADAMSRICNPRDCDCPESDNLEYLKCGPCKKCKKRTIDIQSSISNQLDITDTQTEKICAVKTRQQTKDEHVWTLWEGGGYSNKDLQTFQENDPDLSPVLEWVKTNTRPSSTEMEKISAATRHYWHLWGSIELIDGVLYKTLTKRDGVENYKQLLVPANLKEEVLKKYTTLFCQAILVERNPKANCPEITIGLK
ncbi:unnamed protein product [Mytilus coruscus]|uniref:Reverse transcriptase domain-containing protein n=1 Tax=Mytilus coruscus TaxID=42192 RepID=A0A6J8EC28_MYTCO|nr:unnamed protein product [Mytilus coruscus]